MLHFKHMFASMALAACAGASSVAAGDTSVMYPTTETDLKQALEANSYGGPGMGHVSFAVDIRPNPISFAGQTYPGYIAIQARDDHGQRCHWFLVLDPRITIRTGGTDPTTGALAYNVHWFMPKVFQRDHGCWSPELGDDFAILSYGLSDWRTKAVGHFAKQLPIADTGANLYAKVDYSADMITLQMGWLKMQLQPMAPGQTPQIAPELLPGLKQN